MFDMPEATTGWLVAHTLAVFVAAWIGMRASHRWPLHALLLVRPLLILAIGAYALFFFGSLVLYVLFPSTEALVPLSTTLTMVTWGFICGCFMVIGSRAGVVEWAMEQEMARQRIGAPSRDTARRRQAARDDKLSTTPILGLPQRGPRRESGFAPGDEIPLAQLTTEAPNEAHYMSSLYWFAVTILAFAAAFPWIVFLPMA